MSCAGDYRRGEYRKIASWALLSASHLGVVDVAGDGPLSFRSQVQSEPMLATLESVPGTAGSGGREGLPPGQVCTTAALPGRRLAWGLWSE